VSLPETAAARPGAEPVPATPATPHASPAKTWALVVGGSGIVALGVGAAYGASSLSAYADAERECPTHHACSAAAMSLRDDAQTRAWVANIALGVGAVATAAGVWLWFSPPGSSSKASLHVAPLTGGASLSLAGAL